MSFSCLTHYNSMFQQKAVSLKRRRFRRHSEADFYAHHAVRSSEEILHTVVFKLNI